MHIPQPKMGFFDKDQAEQELEQLIQQPGPLEERPCPNCQIPCDSNIPAQCAVNCDANCDNAPSALSSDPHNHPIECKVVNIVFELSTLRLIQPCWSCEGHLNGQGELWKLPQVSFYTASALYPKLLSSYLTKLKGSKQLHYPWQVIMVDYGQSWEPTYQLEPALNHIDEVIQLTLLQQDLHKISNGLAEQLKQEARIMLLNVRQG